MATKKLRFGSSLDPLRTIAALFLLISAVVTCHAALQFDATVGYNGVLPHNAWFPITCELYNDGPSFSAVIEVSSGKMASQPQTRQLRIELPTNTRKRVMIPVFADNSYQGWTVQLLSEHGKLLAEPTANSLQSSAGTPVIAALSRTSAGVPALPGIKSRNNTLQPVAVRLQTEYFPENPLALDGIPLLYLNSERALALTMPQVNALLAWLHDGGHLVVSAEQVSDLNAAEWLHALLPCELKSMVQLPSHPEFQNWLEEWRSKLQNTEANQKNRRNTPQEPLVIAVDPGFESASLPLLAATVTDGKIIMGTPTAPLAIQAARGLGKITVLTFSPEREPFGSWKNRGWFWAKLAEVSPELYTTENPQFNNYNGVSTDGVFGAMIDSKQVRKLPLGWLLLLLVTYLAVIGPIDRYWLKKINRQMLTWITFPIYVLGFSFLIYLIGFHLRAGDLEWNELSVVDILPREQLAASVPNKARASSQGEVVLRGQTYCSIYSPVNEQYRMASELPFAVFRDEFLSRGAQTASRANVVQHGNAFEAESSVSVWTSRLFVSDWLQSAPAPLSLTAMPAERGWKVTIENKTNRKLTNTRVVLARRLYDLGELQPSMKTNFTLNIDQGKMLFDYINNYASTLRSASQNRNRSFGNNNDFPLDPPLAATVISFVSLLSFDANGWNNFSMPKGLDIGKYTETDNAILLAWDPDYSYTKPLNQFTTHRTHRDTMLRLVVPLKAK